MAMNDSLWSRSGGEYDLGNSESSRTAPDRGVKISLEHFQLKITQNSPGGVIQITKLDDRTRQPQAVDKRAIAPMQLTTSVEWPLPGVAGWTETPTEDRPWKVSPGELFDARSRSTLSCNEWLGQQVVMFDNRGISLKDIMRTVVTYEGAHSLSPSRLLRAENDKDYKPAKNPELHILDNIKICGIKYSHIIAIEGALYLYDKLIENSEVENPIGGRALLNAGNHKILEAFFPSNGRLLPDLGEVRQHKFPRQAARERP